MVGIHGEFNQTEMKVFYNQEIWIILYYVNIFAFIQFVIDENKEKTWSLQSQWTLRPQVGTCPYCLFSYKDYRRYETAVEDTADIILKSNQTDLLKIGYMNSSPHHQKKQKKSRAKEDFWAKVDPSFTKCLIWILKCFNIIDT